MRDRFLLDTNILVYATNSTEPSKREVSQQLIFWGLQSNLGVISFQNVQEWFNYAFRKAPIRYSVREAETIFNHLWAPLWKVQSSPALLESALELRQRFNFSWYDSLVVAAALAYECKTLYSEDLHDGLQVNSLTIKNPFNPPTT